MSTTSSPSVLPTQRFWPDGARLAISVTLGFEGTGQPISGSGGPITEPIAPGYPDLPTNSFFEYGMIEGVPRLLDLFERTGIKVSAFMVGQAVDRNPELAREVVRRGHEAVAHGAVWMNSYTLPPQEERAFIERGMQSIERATGQRPMGYNNYWLRGSVRTLEILQSLGCIYHVDDISRDEPFIQLINGQRFVNVPYTLHLNDIVAFNFTNYSPADHLQVLSDEFDQLYAEAATRRRLMVLSCHDRISGRPARIRTLETFIRYAQSQPGVVFLRKDEIARWALETPEITPFVERAPAEVSGLAGSSGGTPTRLA